MAAAGSSSDEAFINGEITKNKVVVFSKTYCPYCTKAKRVLATAGAKDVVIHELDNMGNGGSLQTILGRMTGASSVPRVFINGKCIGGGDDTEALYRSGKLRPMLEECGAL